MAKVVDVTVNDSEISSELEIDAPAAAKEEIGEYLLEQILLSVADAKTPVSGAPYVSQLTSPTYKAYKGERGQPTIANMDLEGDMLSSLDYELTEIGIKIGIFGDEAPKADGHNNFSGKSSLPPRQFLPFMGESFKANIDKEIEAIAAEYKINEEITPDEFEEVLEDVDSKAEFLEAMIALTGVDDEDLIQKTIKTTPAFLAIIREKGLLKYLK